MRDPKETIPFTEEQRKHLETAPDTAAHAVAAVFRERGRCLSDEHAAQVSNDAVERAAQTFQSGEGREFARYAYWKAYLALLDARRAEGRHARVKAVLQRAFTSRRGTDPRPAPEPEARSFQEVDERAEAALGRLIGKATLWADEMVSALEGEERMAAREEVRAVRTVLKDLQPWEKRLLALRWGSDERIEDVAAQLNVSLSTMQRKTNQLMERLRKRLAELGVTSMPRWLRVEGRGLLAEVCGEEGDGRKGTGERDE